VRSLPEIFSYFALMIMRDIETENFPKPQLG